MKNAVWPEKRFSKSCVQAPVLLVPGSDAAIASNSGRLHPSDGERAVSPPSLQALRCWGPAPREDGGAGPAGARHRAPSAIPSSKQTGYVVRFH